MVITSTFQLIGWSRQQLSALRVNSMLVSSIVFISFCLSTKTSTSSQDGLWLSNFTWYVHLAGSLFHFATFCNEAAVPAYLVITAHIFLTCLRIVSVSNSITGGIDKLFYLSCFKIRWTVLSIYILSFSNSPVGGSQWLKPITILNF